jgi:hypothetical protein
MCDCKQSIRKKPKEQLQLLQSFFGWCRWHIACSVLCQKTSIALLIRRGSRFCFVALAKGLDCRDYLAARELTLMETKDCNNLIATNHLRNLNFRFVGEIEE